MPDATDGMDGMDAVDAQVAEGVDFALVAYREDDRWRLDEIPEERLHDVGTLAAGLRGAHADADSLGLVAFDEDFFVLVRVDETRTRVLLSDVTAATEWAIARSALEELAIPLPSDDDAPEPAGDLGILTDLGVPAQAMGALLDRDELYPDEVLGDLAHRLGFGPLYDDAVGVPAP